MVIGVGGEEAQSFEYFITAGFILHDEVCRRRNDGDDEEEEEEEEEEETEEEEEEEEEEEKKKKKMSKFYSAFRGQFVGDNRSRNPLNTSLQSDSFFKMKLKKRKKKKKKKKKRR